jgi:hypothetical protein
VDSSLTPVLNTFWNQKEHYRVHMNPTPVSVLNKVSPLHNPHPITEKSIILIAFHLHISLSSGHFLSGFPTRTMQAFPFSPKRTKCSVHLILLDLINLIVSGEKHTLQSPQAFCYFVPRTDARLHKHLTLARGVTRWSA